MSYLKERILKDGVIFPNNVLKIDSFLNQQIDPKVMREIVQEIYAYYKDEKITKVLTIEASGIAPAIMVAAQFDVPMLFAKKAKAATLQKDQVYETKVYSYTKGTTSNVVVSKQYLNPQDRVLIIDDFLANGEAALGLIDLVDQAGAQVVGLGICVEKSFQKGRKRLDEAGVKVYSMARIAEINSDRQEIIFAQGH
ncbi:Xanthine phosphoribosyltransferase [Urinicoccus massiliensis]|uniref:Xanthine phosphoribosyltransferase n=1 Tax=Urinicoccus massiliensis TaxID=1723382 RepID=A0A8H2M4Y8_9FIRM|nr:xanthine phosphoribosyltransferase [Urinicoccus massiliensis]VFB16504.1 Xanthine phosphoribosyltransferase [Urinicoccus massiliensis]